MITKLFFDEELKKHYISENANKALNNLNQLNILIGANNTGKSRFLRTVFGDRNFNFEISEFESADISKKFILMLEDLEINLGNAGYEDVSSTNISGLKSVLKIQIENLNHIEIKNINEIANGVITFWSWLKEFKVGGASHKSDHISISVDFVIPTRIVKDIREKYQSSLNELIPKTFNYKAERLYIPILRGLRPTQLFEENKFDEIKDNYLKRTVRDYFKDTLVKEEEIFTGLRLYNDTKRMLLGKREERDKIKNFENFLSKTFFNNQQTHWRRNDA